MWLLRATCGGEGEREREGEREEGKKEGRGMGRREGNRWLEGGSARGKAALKASHGETKTREGQERKRKESKRKKGEETKREETKGEERKEERTTTDLQAQQRVRVHGLQHIATVDCARARD